MDKRGYRGGFYDGDYRPGHGPGGGIRRQGATHAASGGAGNTRPRYGDTLHPTTPGSGGGPEYTADGGNPGHGGGAIEVLASGDVTIDGEISADGATSTVNGWGAGAGGGIYIECRHLSGVGAITADGGRVASGSLQ